MKKYLLKMTIFAVLVFGILLSVGVMIDPYNVFHYENPVNNGVEANKNFIKMKHVLANKEKFDSLIFGSSRAGFVDVTQLEDGRYYNMCSSEAVPAEHLRLIRELIDEGFIPKNLLVMVDDISCFVDPAGHEELLYRVPYPVGGVLDELRFYLRYCDLVTNLESLSVIRAHEDNDAEYAERFRESGSERLDGVSHFDGTNQEGYWSDYYELRLEESIAELQELVDLCEEYDIRLRIVTNPTYYKTYALGAANGYLDFLEALADVTEFYNFSGFSDVTTNDANYFETSHFTPQVTSLMMDVVYGGKTDETLLAQGFGVRVTKENKEEVLALLREQCAENLGQMPGSED